MILLLSLFVTLLYWEMPQKHIPIFLGTLYHGCLFNLKCVRLRESASQPPTGHLHKAISWTTHDMHQSVRDSDIEFVTKYVRISQ